MGDLFRAAAAVEPPDVRAYAHQRRHRPLTGTAGILLFACMFMPALKGCGDTHVMPLELPPFLPPYLYGLVFAFAAQARSPGAMVASVAALRVMAALVACAGFVVCLVAPTVGVVELTIGAVLLGVAGARGHGEHRLAITAVVMGAIGTLWFGMWAMTADALLGVYLSLASSIGLLVGGVIWYAELVLQRASTVPVAIAVSSNHEGFDHRVRSPDADVGM